MSNAIRYDSLLVRYLGQELEGRLCGRSVEALRLDPDARQVALVVDGEALVWRLHPTDGSVLLGPPPALPVEVPIPRRARVRAIVVPDDERLLSIELSSPRHRPGRAARLSIELLGNQWNAVAVDPEGRIVAVLWKRSAGERRLVPGQVYAAPPASDRVGAGAPIDRDTWRTLLGAEDPAHRERVLVARVAYTSPINAAPILGSAARDASPAALDEAYDRYVALASMPTPDPRLLRVDRGPQPYPVPLPGVPGDPYPDLLAAIQAASGAAIPVAGPRIPAALLERLRGRLAQLERRRRRLEEERAEAGPEAARLRRHADLLLSQLHEVRKGMKAVVLSDLEGGTVEIALDPTLAPIENAHRLYAAAKKRERAAERLPALLEQVEREHARLAELLQRAEEGEALAAEVEAAVGSIEEAPVRSGAEPGPTLPYRRYRTSGGLEVRVGRGRQSNDELTFRHSSPNDVWLHARDVGGAHVVLRWNDPNANPPARDLIEAAVLAALNSKARTSGTVAVDWTRRKYVRKPRKAPPGLVTFERGKTVFVEPDASLEERLRV